MSEQHRTGALIPHRPPDDLGVSWHRARDRSRRIEFAVVLAREDPALARSVAAWLEAGRPGRLRAGNDCRRLPFSRPVAGRRDLPGFG